MEDTYPFEMFFFTRNDDLLFLMNVPLWIIFFKSHSRLDSILYSHIDGAYQHFMLTPTIPLALKFIPNFKVSQSHYFIDGAIFGTWVNKCVKIFRSHMKWHLQFGKKAARQAHNSYSALKCVNYEIKICFKESEWEV